MKLWLIEEMAKAIELPGYYRIPADTRDLNYDIYFEKGLKKVSMVQIILRKYSKTNNT